MEVRHEKEGRFQIDRLEERIAPSGGLAVCGGGNGRRRGFAAPATSPGRRADRGSPGETTHASVADSDADLAAPGQSRRYPRRRNARNVRAVGAATWHDYNLVRYLRIQILIR